MAANTTIPGTGITFEKGGLHESLSVPQGEPIPPAKMQAALAGKYGAKAKKQAELAQTLGGMKKKSGTSTLARAAAGTK